MEELENANPTMENPGENPANPNGVEVENPATEPQSTDFSQLFSENIAEETPVKEELAQEEPAQQKEISSPAQYKRKKHHHLHLSLLVALNHTDKSD